MANTGNIIVTERDTNPFSPTYDTTRQRTYTDWIHCIPSGYKWAWTVWDGYGQDGYISCGSGGTTITASEVKYATDAYDEFYDMLRYKSISIGNCVTAIEDNAFESVKHYDVDTLYIPANVLTIGELAFQVCGDEHAQGPKTIEIHSATIGNSAFRYCHKMTTLILGNEVSSIGEFAFYGCDSLTSATIPNSVTTMGQSVFALCSSLTDITFSSNISYIGLNCCGGCTSLRNVTIPDGVGSISAYSFDGCTSLESVTCMATTPPTLHSTSFSNTNSTFTIYVPASSVSAYRTATNWSTYASRIQPISS